MKLNFWNKGTPAPYLEDELNKPYVYKEGTPDEYFRENEEDDGTIVENVEQLRQSVVGHRIVKAEKGKVPHSWYRSTDKADGFLITLDNGTQVALGNSDDCCAYTDLEDFLLNPESVDHVIMGVATEDGYSTWSIYADYGDILKLQVGWSCGNPFYYGYGFDINIVDVYGEIIPTDD